MRSSEKWAALGLCRGCGSSRETSRVRCDACIAREKTRRDAKDKNLVLPISLDALECLWRHVPYKPEDVKSCWEWCGALDEKGYGRISVCGRRRRTHRISYMIAYGEIPEGLSVCHTCDNRRCVRPSHFFLGTNVDNNADMVAKGRNRWSDGTKTSGERHFQHKLTDEVVVLIRRRIRNGEKGRDIARELGVSEATLSEAKNGRLWDHVNHLEPPLKPWCKR